MPVGDVTRPDLNRNTRRAIQMFMAWRRDDTDALFDLTEEIEQADEQLINVVCGLLYVGDNLIKAAADGQFDHYAEQLLGAALAEDAVTSTDP